SSTEGPAGAGDMVGVVPRRPGSGKAAGGSRRGSIIEPDRATGAQERVRPSSRTRRPGALLRRRKGAGRRWRLPRLGPARALRWLRPSWRVVRWVLAAGLLLGLLASAAAAIAAYLYWPTDLPNVKALEEYAPTTGTKVYADDDELLTEFQAERRV